MASASASAQSDLALGDELGTLGELAVELGVEREALGDACG